MHKSSNHCPALIIGSERTRAIAEQVALTGLTPLEVVMEAMRHYQAIGNRDKTVAIAKDAAPYMHPRLHAVARSDGVPIVPDDKQSLATIARKVALAFRLAAREERTLADRGCGRWGLTKP